MANSYFIKIELPSEDTKKSAVAGTGTGSTGKDQTSADESSGSAATDKIVKKLKSLVSFSAVKSTADTIINNRINRVSLETGATEYEQRLSAGYNLGSSVVGAGASLVLGGIAGGPAGLAVAAISIITNGIQKAMNIANKQMMLNRQQSLEDISIGMATVRAGVSGRRDKNQ